MLQHLIQLKFRPLWRGQFQGYSLFHRRPLSCLFPWFFLVSLVITGLACCFHSDVPESYCLPPKYSLSSRVLLDLSFPTLCRKLSQSFWEISEISVLMGYLFRRQNLGTTWAGVSLWAWAGHWLVAVASGLLGLTLLAWNYVPWLGWVNGCWGPRILLCMGKGFYPEWGLGREREYLIWWYSTEIQPLPCNSQLERMRNAAGLPCQRDTTHWDWSWGERTACHLGHIHQDLGFHPAELERVGEAASQVSNTTDFFSEIQ